MILLVACTSTGGAPPTDGEAPGPPDESEGADTVAAVETADPLDEAPCLPEADVAYATEGEAVVVELRCAGAGESPTFGVAPLPSGAVVEGTTLRWTPDLDQAGRWDLELSTPTGEHGWTTIWVADAWNDAANLPVDPTAYPEEFGLPVLHLERPDNTSDTTEVATSLVYRGQPYDVTVKYRGAASSYYPKRSYTLGFSADHEFEDPATAFPARRKIVLTTLFDDNAYTRQKLCFDIWNALDPAQHRVETRFVVVYINGAYEGLYLLGDHIDSEWWQDQGFADGAGANVYKAVDHAANFYRTYGGRGKSSLHQGYEKRHGAEGDWSDLDALVAWVSDADDATFESGLGGQVALSEFLDWWILVRFTEADDSGGKNAYLYDDLAAPLFHYAPWDFNHSLGQTWQTDRESVYTDYDFASANNIFSRVLASPALSVGLYDRYRAALAGPLAPASMLATLNVYYAEIDPSARRDWEKWADSYYGYSGWSWRTNWTTYDEEVAYLRAWVTERQVFMTGLYP